MITLNETEEGSLLGNEDEDDHGLQVRFIVFCGIWDEIFVFRTRTNRLTIARNNKK